MYVFCTQPSSNATILFRPILSFILSLFFNPAPGCNTEYILCYVYVMSFTPIKRSRSQSVVGCEALGEESGQRGEWPIVLMCLYCLASSSSHWFSRHADIQTCSPRTQHASPPSSFVFSNPRPLGMDSYIHLMLLYRTPCSGHTTHTPTELSAPVTEVIECDDILSKPPADVCHKLSKYRRAKMSTVKRLCDVWWTDTYS